MSATFLLTVDGGQPEMVRDAVEALARFLAALRENDTATLEWSSWPN